MSRASALKKRAEMLASVRRFFSQRDVLEVDPGSLLQRPPIDAHIDCFETKEGLFLHTSPEYTMKRLLSEGVKDCYFLGHVFRKEEEGSRHHPEFTMIEWYRLHFSLEQMIQETIDLLSLFLPPQKSRILSYEQAFENFLSIDPYTASLKELQALTKQPWERKTCLHYLMSHHIEPHLGKDELTVLTDYPEDEAALARLDFKKNRWVAKRFEIYFKGIELCNGYHELSDEQEILKRFEAINEQRVKEQKDPYLPDEKFLRSLKHLPDCCGVALGFDRALMLHVQASSIKQILPLPSERWE